MLHAIPADLRTPNSICAIFCGACASAMNSFECCASVVRSEKDGRGAGAAAAGATRSDAIVSRVQCASSVPLSLSDLLARFVVVCVPVHIMRIGVSPDSFSDFKNF